MLSHVRFDGRSRIENQIEESGLTVFADHFVTLSNSITKDASNNVRVYIPNEL